MKCTICKKKINKIYSVISTCKCDNMYCLQHLRNHECSYDYKKEFKKFQEENMQKIIPDKIAKI